ncbi:MAG TPA: nicotinate (nicotinamide) nucleotide adenylyltransferase [Candidatus Krumholzibacteria bacterium]|nr:nicotinate (nicotinamide) nucleotide adenylyltransferase [Candidatus Krumholzibacteria bacterium]
MTHTAERWDGARIGILGGTFDPPHVGPGRMAGTARDVLGLDRVFFSVAPAPPHKQGEPVSAYPHRVAMVEAAVADDDGLALTRIEESHTPSFTVDLLRACRARTSADLYFIMGADSLAELNSWREPEEVLRLATAVAFPRTGAAIRVPVAGGAAVVVFEEPVIDVSSTAVRARLARGEYPDDVPPAVAHYIERSRLYARA